jgi:TPR repeat protein
MAWYKSRTFIISIILAIIGSPLWTNFFSSSPEKVSIEMLEAGSTTVGSVSGDHNTVFSGQRNKVSGYENKANVDYATAQYYLGLAYRDGRGIAFSNAKAVQAWAEAANHGHPIAQYLLGQAYETGRGASLNRVDALKWFQKAYDQGHLDAAHALGFSYINDGGDFGHGIKFLKEAANQGHKDAEELLEILKKRWSALHKHHQASMSE